MAFKRSGLWTTAASLASSIIAAASASAMVGPTSTGSPLAASVVMVLWRHDRAAGFCSGVVLAPEVVLTAAHCVPPGSDVRIHLPGTAADPVMLPVRDVVLHPDFRPDAIRQRERSIDLALVRLSAPLPDRYRAAHLALRAGTAPGARFVASGYGVAREGEAASSGILRSATLAARVPSSDVLLWAEDPAKHGAGACTGDSGGPVTAADNSDVSALLVWSAGTGARRCGALTQAVWLAPQKPWVDGVLEAWGATP